MTPRERLTPKEIEVATMVWEGLTNREIGRLLGTTEQVIKNHLRTTFDKLGVWSRLELAMYVASHGEKTGSRNRTGGCLMRSPARSPVRNTLPRAPGLLQKVCTLGRGAPCEYHATD